MTTRRATAIGFTAVLFWSLLALLTAATGTIPPFQLAAMTILIGGLVGVASWIVRPNGIKTLRQKPAVCAFVAAFVWAAYSVLSRRFGEVPSDAVAGFCLAASLLSLMCHMLFETTVWPQTSTQWLALAALGIGPVGAAFYVWDVGMKRGD